MHQLPKIDGCTYTRRTRSNKGLGPSILCPSTNNNNAHYKTKKGTLGEKASVAQRSHSMITLSYFQLSMTLKKTEQIAEAKEYFC